MNTSPLSSLATADSITFDEADAGTLFMTVIQYIKNNRWDPSLEEEWELLKQLKDIEERLRTFLDGSPP
jgi:hypothetical protein